MPKVYAAETPQISDREKKNRDLAREAGTECIVLLENDGLLPLRSPGSVALYGVGARHTVRGGTGSGDVYTRGDVSVEQGLRNAGFNVTSTDWLERQDGAYSRALEEYETWVAEYAAKHDMLDLLVRFSHPFRLPAPVPVTEEDIASSPADVAVYVIARSSGEGSDRFAAAGDFELYKEEVEQIRNLAEAYPGLIVVLNTGGIVDISSIVHLPGVRSVVHMGQLGSTGGDALADVITGQVTPSGKLTDTWAQRYEDYPAADTYSHNGGNLDDEYYREGIYVGYRYFDSFRVKPLYPFGFGGSYTTFSITPRSTAVEGDTVRVTVDVSNTGDQYSGKEVVQVYATAPASDVRKPYQTLVAYAKTEELAPGESETLTVSFRVQDLASYSTQRAAWLLDAGDYTVRVGNSSRDTVPASALSLPELVETARLRNLFRDSDPVTEDPAPPAWWADETASVPRIAIDPKAVNCSQAEYQDVRLPYSTDIREILTAADVRDGKCTAEELTAQLSVPEMADLCVGTLRQDGNIVGNASHAVAGAAGDTSSALSESRGIGGLVMADGPAGLRLTPVFRADSNGHVLGPDEKAGDARTYYQYCTAVPVGTALAQSWNEDLVEEVGRMIGEEMEAFGVEVWLAPALNIHRNPLCGRNFEYYSEDPLVSGRTAAAITRGVQSHPGRAVTIKHFAANNQEDNRYFTNAHVSEQALREIYLKGFEKAVREAQPAAIMTSYNLLNGVHTANSRDLLQSVCRDEWGFGGFIMTDWFTSVDEPALTGGGTHKYPISASTGCIWAGNDVQMPGAEQNVEDIVNAVETGSEIDGYSISLADLQFCAANVIRTVLRLLP